MWPKSVRICTPENALCLLDLCRLVWWLTPSSAVSSNLRAKAELALGSL